LPFITLIARCAAAIAAGALGAGLIHAEALASDFPTKPLRVIVPFPPGGLNDLLARLLGARLAERLGQQVVIDNRPGANTIIGTEMAARATPDGYTFMIVPAGHAVNPSVYRRLPYDTVKDLRGVAFIGDSPYVLAVHPGLRVKTAGELIELVRRKPSQVSYSSSGIGNMTHLASELLNEIAGVKLVHVPYKGTGQLMSDLMSGNVPVSIISFSSGRNYVKTGKISLLGVTTAKRNPVLPDLPTLAESGLPGYEVSGWYGFVAPSATPATRVNTLHAEIAAVLAMPEIRDNVANQGVDVVRMTPSAFDDLIVKEIGKWHGLVKRLGISADWGRPS